MYSRRNAACRGSSEGFSDVTLRSRRDDGRVDDGHDATERRRTPNHRRDEAGRLGGSKASGPRAECRHVERRNVGRSPVLAEIPQPRADHSPAGSCAMQAHALLMAASSRCSCPMRRLPVLIFSVVCVSSNELLAQEGGDCVLFFRPSYRKRWSSGSGCSGPTTVTDR